MHGILGLGIWIRTFLRGRASAATEILALRQRLAVLKRQSKRPRLHDRDRLFWILLKRFWPSWRDALLIVQPETVVRWHRAGFRHYWRWKSRPKGGRKPIDQELRTLIRRLCRENPIWGAPRIQSELTLLGYSVSEATVAKYMPARSPQPSATWNTFLRNLWLLETSSAQFSHDLSMRDWIHCQVGRDCHPQTRPGTAGCYAAGYVRPSASSSLRMGVDRWRFMGVARPRA